MDRPSADIRLELARCEQSPILANLLELYAHDFSEFQPLDISLDGRFGYKSLPLYWSESNRHPFLIRFDGKLAGFALVKRGRRFLIRTFGTWRNSLFSVVAADAE
jgi:hypothetical protein